MTAGRKHQDEAPTASIFAVWERASQAPFLAACAQIEYI